MFLALGFIGVYILLVGMASFAEKLVAPSLDAFQLDLTVRSGVLLLAMPAVVIAHGLTAPGAPTLLGGLGIGALAGAGLLFYFLALEHLPVSLVVCLADGSVLVTAFLGIVVLGEAATVTRIAGLLLTVAGIILLSYQGHQGEGKGPSGQNSKKLLYLACMAGNILLIGTSSFLEKPALKHLDPLQLNALVALGMCAIGLMAVLALRRPIPVEWATGKGLGIGVMIGVANIFYYLGLSHLPVSVSATLANTYILVTVGLTIVVRHRTVTALKIGAIATLVAGVVLLTVRVHL